MRDLDNSRMHIMLQACQMHLLAPQLSFDDSRISKADSPCGGSRIESMPLAGGVGVEERKSRV